MADNLDITAGTGTTIATDQDASAPNAHYQLVKLAWGPLNTFNVTDTASGKPFPTQIRDASGNAIGSTSNALDVNIKSLSGANANGQATAANSAPVVQASDRQNTVCYSISMTTDTSAYASGELIADTQQLNAFFNMTDGKGVINSITIFDAEDNTAAGYYVLFHQTSTSMGTENTTPNISDANAAAGILGYVAVASTDWLDIGGSKVACVRNIGLPVSAVSGTDDLYVSVVNGSGTPTFAGGALKMVIGALLD